jgi:small subunit ribosomal protein S17
MRVAGKRILEGIVTSDKMIKTIVVTVINRHSHSTYNRAVIKRKKYKVHDEKKSAKVGDRVKIIECAPRSKEKRFELLQVIK